MKVKLRDLQLDIARATGDIVIFYCLVFNSVLPGDGIFCMKLPTVKRANYFISKFSSNTEKQQLSALLNTLNHKHR
jgi:hypothetical protein